MNALRRLGRKIIRKIYGPIKEGERWRIRMKKEIQGIIQGADIVKFTKSLRLRSYGHVERMPNHRMPKQLATTTKEGAWKRGRPRKRWRDDVAEDLETLGVKNGLKRLGTGGNGGRLYCKPRSTRDCSARKEEE
jgi:hypothetical protein